MYKSTNAVILLCFISVSSYADSEMDELLNMNLEELMEMNISIATKSEKALSTTAAPVFVISADDIRRSGSANIPEALRMAPGLQVTQINPHDWNVSIRGFNDQAANRLLVLVDGRSVNSGFTSGTYWRDLQAFSMESIDRIEIIRGAGGTIWGANAMNGVINIITRSALTTKDAQLTAGSGSAQQDFGRFDYTKKLDDNINVRGYGTYYNVADAKGPANYEGSAGSGWSNGARLDWDNKQSDALMVDANWSENNSEETGLLTTLHAPYTQAINSQPFNHQSGHFLTRWEHHLTEKNYWAIRAYYDYVNRKDFSLGVKLDTFDIDITHYFLLSEKHHLTWGAGYRKMRDNIASSIMLTVNPATNSNSIYNVFAQDEIALDDNKQWLFTLGSKVDHYTLTGFQVEPSASLNWRMTSQHTLWTSVSHAVRSPPRNQNGDMSYLIFNSLRNIGNMTLPVMSQATSKKGIDAENVTMYQMGWRGSFSSDFTADATIFYARYANIIRPESVTSAYFSNSLGIPAIISPWLANNNLDAQSYGAELSLNWQATFWWRNYLSYSFLQMNVQPYAGHTLTFYDPVGLEKSTPQHQVSLRTNFNVTHDIDFDIWWRYTGAIVANQLFINGYFNSDARLAWRPVKDLELSLIGQNLIQTQHIEYQGDFLQPQTTYVSRGVYAKFNWQF